MRENTFDLARKNWFIPFFREIYERFDVAAAQRSVEPWLELDSEERFNTWRVWALRERGLLKGALMPIWCLVEEDSDDEEAKGHWFFLNTLAHQIELLLELRLLYERDLAALHSHLEVLLVFAAFVGAFDATENIYELSLEDWGEIDDPRRKDLAKALTEPARLIGNRLKATTLFDSDQPLLGLPFHHVIIYSNTRQILNIGRRFFESATRPDEQAARQINAQGVMEKVDLIEAIIGLAQADGVITHVERRLVENVISVATLPKKELEMITPLSEETQSAAELGARIKAPLSQHFIFVQLVLHSLLEGPQHESETQYIEAFGKAMGMSDLQRLQYETEAFAFMQDHPELLNAFKLTRVLKRFSHHIGLRLEGVVKRNLAHIVVEIKETRELGHLLVKRTKGALTEEEDAKVKEQLSDICKSIPALALFAVPGGSLLLPIVIKLLPFDILPTAFVEDDEEI